MRTTDVPPYRSAAELDELLQPALLFDHPREVVEDPDLSLAEKRAILASWASDARAVEAVPSLRYNPVTRGTVQVEAILEALQALDRKARGLRVDIEASQPARR